MLRGHSAAYSGGPPKQPPKAKAQYCPAIGTGSNLRRHNQVFNQRPARLLMEMHAH
jgi:hypothetical protein